MFRTRRIVRVSVPVDRTAIVGGRAAATGRPSESWSAPPPYESRGDASDSPGTEDARSAAAAASDLSDELKRLAELNTAGALTDAEFAVAKAHLLTR